MGTLAQLANEIRKLANDAALRGAEAKRVCARAIAHDVIDHTPVDEGDTVSSWQIGIGGPAVGRRDAFARGRKGSTADANRSAAKAAVDAALAAPIAPGVPIFISNGSDAIGFLNDGSSKQEPAGFVERGLVVGRLAVADFNAVGKR